MARHKHAYIRYKALDECFRNKGRLYYIDDLVEECNKALSYFDPNTNGIQKRQCYDDIAFMQSLDGFDAPIERIKDGRRTYLRYSDPDFTISSIPLTETELNQIHQALAVLNRFSGLPQFDWIYELTPKLDSINHETPSEQIISFDDNEYLKGREYISDIFNAIVYKKNLTITYKSFKTHQANSLSISPYFLKQYNNRWFLFATTKGFQSISIFALDRITDVEQNNDEYKQNTTDWNEYFYDVIGVSVNDQDVKNITFEVTSISAPYIKTKPIHGSQRIVEEKENSTVFQISVIPNHEMYAVLLSYGANIKVLSPKSIIEKLQTILQNSLNNYNTN